MSLRVLARKPRATRGREALADASPEPSFALGAISHRSNRVNVNKLRLCTSRWPIAVRRDVALCADLPPGTAGIVELAGGHHFDGDYDELARLILKFAGRSP